MGKPKPPPKHYPWDQHKVSFPISTFYRIDQNKISIQFMIYWHFTYLYSILCSTDSNIWCVAKINRHINHNMGSTKITTFTISITKSVFSNASNSSSIKEVVKWGDFAFFAENPFYLSNHLVTKKTESDWCEVKAEARFSKNIFQE